ncbi:S-adenosyl-L-methionine-dependent methyltransferase [Ostreococcus tauri]|uniref:S-adenosyl-L-methionine-dependent methyltransferase n=2 Tax=Ostreococcus tauri TaxID=70448 RepID=A0A1Y5I5D2_OSTTA|nr:S-adenosyl-L-methionine-dependent methyltransferase [Ostreococcus tauri]
MRGRTTCASRAGASRTSPGARARGTAIEHHRSRVVIDRARWATARAWTRGRRARGRSRAIDGGERCYDEPEMYACAFGFRDFEAEVTFLDACARRHGTHAGEAGEGEGMTSVLELGAGPAWHSLEAARRGVQAVALEKSGAMRAHARNEAQDIGARNVRVIDGDMREINLDPMTVPVNGFDVVTMLLGTAAHLLTHDDAIRCLRAVRRNLKPGGIFVVELEHPWDLFSGDIREGAGDAWDREDEERGVKVFVEWGRDGDNFDIETQIYERTVSFSLVSLATNEVIKIVEDVVPCKIFTAPEFIALASAAGLTSVAVYGDMDVRVALDDENAHNMVMVFRREHE